MASFKCAVCFGQCLNRLPLPALSTVNGDVLRARDCGHPVCQSCLAAFVIARVEDLRPFGICCPIEGCKNMLYEQDVDKLVKAGVLKQEVATQLATVRKQNYTFRVSDAVDDLCSNRECLSMRLCPRCNVIIQKSSGCNSFGCICGHKFNFTTALTIRDVIVAKDMAKDVASKLNLSQSDAMERVISALLSKGIKYYKRVLIFAEQRHIDLDLAEVHVQALLGHSTALDQLRNARRARKETRMQEMLTKHLNMSNDEARAIIHKARDGDITASEKIREARQLRKGGTNTNDAA